MIYKNVELFNVQEIINNEDGSISWLRVPDSVYNNLEGDNGPKMAKGSTGVEIRFVIKSGKSVKIRMATEAGEGIFHIFRGGVQGGWMDHEVHKFVRTEPEDFEIEATEYKKEVAEISKVSGLTFDTEVIRIIFDRGTFKIYDISGDIEPPKKSQTPEKTILNYGSSITHGSNALDTSHSWASMLGYNLKMDVRNLGMAGSCFIEPDFADFIANEGEKGNWDIATLELGINVLDWEEEKIEERVKYIIDTVAGRNLQKPVFVISPMYYCGDYFDETPKTEKWRRIIKQEVEKCAYENVTYINGVDLIDSISFMSADLIHPNIYGAAQISERLTNIIKNKLNMN